MSSILAAALRLVEEITLPRLVPGRNTASSDEVRSRIEAVFSASKIAAADVAATALRAGLWQWHDFLDESHTLAQTIEGELLGDCWHAIMHRREPDYGNAKYWYRRLGRPAHFDGLNRDAPQVLARCATADAARWASQLSGPRGWNPLAFVDLCEACAGDEESALALSAREIQRIEMRLLLEQTCAAVAVE